MIQIVLVNAEENEESHISVDTLAQAHKKVSKIYEPAVIKNIDSNNVIAYWFGPSEEDAFYDGRQGHWIWIH